MRTKSYIFIVALLLMSLWGFSQTMDWENYENKSDKQIKESLKSIIGNFTESGSGKYIELKGKANLEKNKLSSTYQQELSSVDNIYKKAKTKYDNNLSEVNQLKTTTSDLETDIINLETKINDSEKHIVRENNAVKDIKKQISKDLESIPQYAIVVGWIEKKRSDKTSLNRKHISNTLSLEAIKHVNKLEIISNVIIDNDLNITDIIQAKTSGECILDNQDFSVSDGNHSPPRHYFVSYGIAEVFPLKESSNLEANFTNNKRIGFRIIKDNQSISKIPDFITSQRPELERNLRSFLRNALDQNVVSKSNMQELTTSISARIEEKEKSSAEASKFELSFKGKTSAIP